MNFQLSTSDANETEAIAETIGKALKGGEVIELNSDLGGGKTTFVRGLARGFGSTDRVASPTFMISKVYKRGEQELHHFDFYRLQESGLIEYELEDVLDNPKNVTVVEWSGVIQHVLPKERLIIEITTVGDTERQLSFTVPDSLSYLVKQVQEL
jgi:tRNA threonylcarbamoyladenosine biosynthesis protein TsaE